MIGETGFVFAKVIPGLDVKKLKGFKTSADSNYIGKFICKYSRFLKRNLHMFNFKSSTSYLFDTKDCCLQRDRLKIYNELFLQNCICIIFVRKGW